MPRSLLSLAESTGDEKGMSRCLQQGQTGITFRNAIGVVACIQDPLRRVETDDKTRLRKQSGFLVKQGSVGDCHRIVELLQATLHRTATVAANAAATVERQVVDFQFGKSVDKRHDHAQVLFAASWPQLPSGWHGVSTERTGLQGSVVWITE